MLNRYATFLVSSTLLFSMHVSAATRESWNSPRLEPGALKAMEPVTGEHSEFPTFTSDLVRVQWRADDPIYLYILVPKLVRNPPVILYLYNYDSDTERFLDPTFAAQLTSGGFAAVGFSSALSGHRYHDRPMTQWFVSELQESLGTSVHDVTMILDYLGTRGDMNASRAGMFGVGSGATIAILAAAEDPRLKALGLLNPWGDWPEWVRNSKVIPDDERPAIDTTTFLDSVANLDPVRYLPKLTIPISLQYMFAEASIPKVAQEQIKSAAPKRAVVAPTDKAVADFKATGGQSIVNWIKSGLSSP